MTDEQMENARHIIEVHLRRIAELEAKPEEELTLGVAMQLTRRIRELEAQLAMASSANGVTSTVYPELYAARERIAELEAALDVALEAMQSLDGVGTVVQWAGQWELVHAAIAKLKELK